MIKVPGLDEYVLIHRVISIVLIHLTLENSDVLKTGRQDHPYSRKDMVNFC